MSEKLAFQTLAGCVLSQGRCSFVRGAVSVKVTGLDLVHVGPERGTMLKSFCASRYGAVLINIHHTVVGREQE